MKELSRKQNTFVERKAMKTAGSESLRLTGQVRTKLRAPEEPNTRATSSQNQTSDGIMQRLRIGRESRRTQVFVRQPFTESGNAEKEIIQGVLDILGSLDIDVVTGLDAQSQETFRASFEKTTGTVFTPRNFRSVRLALLQAADAMVFIRTSLSESGAFETAYNVYGGSRVPMFFAVWKNAPIKTTLLRDLDEFCMAEYVTFETPEELRHSLVSFIVRATEKAYAGAGAYTKKAAASTSVRRHRLSWTNARQPRLAGVLNDGG
jgi:carbamoyl-phosphate synthase large subunit